jgi:hypothetical protein
MPSLDESNRISLKFKISEILFGGHDRGATSPKRDTNETRPSNVQSGAFWDALGDAAEDALIKLNPGRASNLID